MMMMKHVELGGFDKVYQIKGVYEVRELSHSFTQMVHRVKNLMEELGKIYRIIDRELPYSDREVLLVLDATTGQNAVNQAREFKDIAEVTGIILTKLDGTAKGGVVLNIKNELKIPVKFIGVGEKIDDFQPFSPTEFAAALFGEG